MPVFDGDDALRVRKARMRVSPPPCTGGRHQWNAHRPKLKFRGKETTFDCCPACGVTVFKALKDSPKGGSRARRTGSAECEKELSARIRLAGGPATQPVLR